MGALESSNIEKLYLELCEKNNIDDGDGFEYEVYAIFESFDEGEVFWDFGSPYNVLDRFSNIVALISGQPIGMCRVMLSLDGQKSIFNTERIYSSNEFIYNDLIDVWPEISDIDLNSISRCYNNAKCYYDKEGMNGRIVNALSYYYYAWRSQSLEQICINIAIVLEILFSPHSNSEINHQIAYNVSRFMGSNNEERKVIYESVKKFYAVRSAIIHGGIPKYEKIKDTIIKGYVIVTNILRKIMTDGDSCQIFTDEIKRKHLLSNYIFE
jgi:hypothetical protein